MTAEVEFTDEERALLLKVLATIDPNEDLIGVLMKHVNHYENTNSIETICSIVRKLKR